MQSIKGRKNKKKKKPKEKKMNNDAVRHAILDTLSARE